LFVLLRPICFSQMCSWQNDNDQLGGPENVWVELTKRFSAVVHLSRQPSHLHRRESSPLLVGNVAAVELVVVLAAESVSTVREGAVSCI
jgi:hypothetical protein